MRDETITLRDGRTLAYTVLGAADQRVKVAVYFHGAPTSRLDLVEADARFAEAGVRVVCPDRPGYGGSSPMPGRTMVDPVHDVVTLAERLGLDGFAAVGLSSGGPYALACAALLGERVGTAAVVAGVSDFGWGGAWHGYVEHECEMMRQPSEAAAVTFCEARFGADGMGFLGDDAPSRDAGATTSGSRRGGFFLSIVEAFRQGVGGYAQDVWVQGRRWPFDPATITAPVRIFHGDADPVVPLAHARHTASLVPGAHLEVWPGFTHSEACSRAPDVVVSLFT
jgi:pimeloyl-ACP methyl ester carboxylesterase